MSFLSILKTIGKDSLTVVNAASPIANVFLPGAGTAISALTGLVIAAENHPSASVSSSGAAKQTWVIDAFTAGFPIIKAIAASHGEIINLNQAALPGLVNGIVAVLNGLHDLNFSMTSSTSTTTTSTVVTK